VISVRDAPAKIALCLWFDGKAEEAANFYVATFRDCGQAAEIRQASAMAVAFTLAEQNILGLNGGPLYRFSPAISLIVNCGDQQEVDAFWERLSDGGQPGRCGWLTDRFGVSWQVVPTILPTLLRGDQARSERVMQALMGMTKLDISGLTAAYESALPD
jgi:predicted 3-demethylubiquinone-9 3-methyltransferase (glyoxalase superfamily)